MRDENEEDLYKCEAHRQYYVTNIYVNLKKLALVVAFIQSFLKLSYYKQALLFEQGETCGRAFL
jgi:hypothetical protein